MGWINVAESEELISNRKKNEQKTNSKTGKKDNKNTMHQKLKKYNFQTTTDKSDEIKETSFRINTVLI